MPPIRFQPIYQPRVWGGRSLQTFLQRKDLPPGNIGESWDLVDRPQAQSICISEDFYGKTLQEICKKHGRDILSPNWDENSSFPLIVKWLDCKERLSLQVHPSLQMAQKLGGETKTECWIIVNAANNAQIFHGVKEGTSQEVFSNALKDKTIENFLQKSTVKQDDCILIPAGCVHTLDAGSLILEIQQNSDTTYRLDDWGHGREVQIDKALPCINWQSRPQLKTSNKAKNEILLQDELFTIERYRLQAGESLTLEPKDMAQILSITSGELLEAKLSENLLIPYGENLKVKALKPTTIILTSKFI